MNFFTRIAWFDHQWVAARTQKSVDLGFTKKSFTKNCVEEVEKNPEINRLWNQTLNCPYALIEENSVWKKLIRPILCKEIQLMHVMENKIRNYFVKNLFSHDRFENTHLQVQLASPDNSRLYFWRIELNYYCTMMQFVFKEIHLTGLDELCQYVRKKTQSIRIRLIEDWKKFIFRNWSFVWFWSQLESSKICSIKFNI